MLLLTLGYVLLALAVIFVCVCATDLYIAQKRLDALADAAALAGAEGFTVVSDDGTARAELTDTGVAQQADALVAEVRGEGHGRVSGHARRRLGPGHGHHGLAAAAVGTVRSRGRAAGGDGHESHRVAVVLPPWRGPHREA